ncbi:hypothetical protein LTR10_023777 [Elasticomyces elasticus]|nr:hypothetical protein LTR10_023777 [Elasticomyces elasticus]KAK5185961.1 hypothetical protein LTR44_002010 [Eurotiomycetes sp. CCFEE 6388]
MDNRPTSVLREQRTGDPANTAVPQPPSTYYNTVPSPGKEERANPAEDGDGDGDNDDESFEITETVMPPPAQRDDPRRPSWENMVHQRSRSEKHSDDKQEGDLTEMTMPPPAGPEDPRRDSLENAVRRWSTSRSRRKDHEAALGEVAATEPASEGRRLSDEETPNGHTSPSDEHKLPEEENRDFMPSPWVRELATVSWLIFFSLLGTLARLGVQAVTLYPGTPVTSRVLWANLGGSFIMGFLAEDRRLFRQEWGSPDLKAPASNHGKVKKTIPLYIGLATGFCGSFTSFSSFMRDAFLALTNDLQGPSETSPYHSQTTIHSRYGGFSFLALLGILILHPAISLAALNVGAQFALLLQPITPTIPVRFARYVLEPIAFVLGIGCWLGAIFLAIWPPGNDIHWRFRAVFPLVFAPPGCLLRFYASKHLNAIIPAFPLGTFVVNIFGTAVLGMAFDLQHAGGIGASSPNACAVLQGIMDGFCGCLTTVSTWVAELNSLRRSHSWIYGSTSAGTGLAIMVIIMGSMGWTVGFQSPACS